MTKSIRLLFLMLSVAVFSGCANVPPGDPAYDPLETPNRGVFAFNVVIDKAIVGPIARGYDAITPDPVQHSVTNFFSNIKYINTILNSFLQGKFRDGAKDTGRFLVNSTIGVVGLFDVATHIGLEEHKEDLGQTLAVWGAADGAYLMLPALGPETVRTVPDIVMRNATNLLTYAQESVYWPLLILDVINTRASYDSVAKMVYESTDPYIFVREAYLQNRVNKIYDGHPPEIDMFEDEDFEDDEDE